MGWQLVPGTYVAHDLKCISTNVVKNIKSNITYNVSENYALVYIFRVQVNERIFQPAKYLLKRRNIFLFPSVSILLSYVELYAQLKDGSNGRGKSEKLFTQEICNIIPNCSLQDATMIYRDVRCGLAHDGMTRGGVTLSYNGGRTSLPISHSPDDNLVIINPKSLYYSIRDAHKGYCEQLDVECRGHLQRGRLIDNFINIYSRMIGVTNERHRQE